MSLDSPILQHRRTACGLATLIMIDHHFGGQITAVQFEAMYGVAHQQWSAADLVQHATRLGLSVLTLELEPAELPALTLPCILHWQMNHFVVLREIRWGRYIIDDPAVGRLTIDKQMLLDHFTGVALTFQPLINKQLTAISAQARIAASKDLTVQANQLTSLVFHLMVGALQAGIPVIIKFILDEVIISQDFALLQSVTVGLLLILLAMPLITHLQQRLLMDCSQHLEQHALFKLLDNQIAAPSGAFESTDVQAALKHVQRLYAFGQFYGAEAVRIVGDLVLAVGLLSVLWLIHPASGGLMTVASAVLICTSIWFTHPIISAEKCANNSEQTRLKHLMEWFSHHREIRRYRAEQPFLNRIIQALQAFHSQQSLAADHKARMTLVNQFTVGISLSLLVYGIALETMIGQLSLGGLYLILAYRGLLTQYILSMCQQLTKARSAQEIRHDLRELRPPDQITASTESTRIDSSEQRVSSTQTSQFGSLHYRQLTPSTSFAHLRSTILAPGSVGACPGSEGREFWPSPITTTATTDAIFNTTILANITMMAAAPDLARVDRLIQQLALTHAIYRHPLGLDTVITLDEHRFDRFEYARLMLTRALYTEPRCLVCELPSVIAACSVMQQTLQRLVRTGLTIELRSHDSIPPIEGLSLVWQTTRGWRQHID
jgi:ATP-binding cassette subfamily B protein RaxB